MDAAPPARRNFIRIALAFLAVAAAAVAGWWGLGRPVALVDMPGGRIECLSYTVTYPGGSPIDPDFKAPPGMLDADMKALKPLTDCIRTYSSLGSQGDAAAAAAKAGIKVMLGIWVSADDAATAKEIARAVELAKAYPDAIRMLVVGNEVLLRREMTPEKLGRIIRSVKAQVPHPVTYADIYEFWRRNAKLADSVDVISVHVLPYWDDPTPVSIDEVQAHIKGIVDRARATFPGRAMLIGEIGWPSAGRTRGAARPSVVNEARFLREFARNATSVGLPYNVIEAVDQHWKRRPEGTVGGFWGVLDGARQLKFPLSGPVSEWPHWCWAAAISVLGALVGVLWAWRLGAGGFGRPFLAAAAGALGAAFSFAFIDQAIKFAIGAPGMLWGIYLAGVGLLGALFVVHRAAGGDARAIAAFRWAVLVPAAMVALSMAVDGRHRDFLTLAFLMPALALMLAKPDSTHLRERAWLAIVIAVAAPFAVDAWVNREAIFWMLCSFALAWPERAGAAAELSRLSGRLVGRKPAAEQK
jgi:exo-beta-1,3-glucanase (GH17 family)